MRATSSIQCPFITHQLYMIRRPVPDTHRSRALVSVKMEELYFFQVFATYSRAIRKNKGWSRKRRRTMNGIHNLQTSIWILVPQTFKYELKVRWATANGLNCVRKVKVETDRSPPRWIRVGWGHRVWKMNHGSTTRWWNLREPDIIQISTTTYR